MFVLYETAAALLMFENIELDTAFGHSSLSVKGGVSVLSSSL